MTRAWFVALLMVPLNAAAQPSDARGSATEIVKRIQRADYEGDRPALRALHGELAALAAPAGDPQLLSRLRYWRGFALWRLAINGFNDNVDSAELASALEQAIAEFDAATQHDSTFIDPTVGAISCGQALAFLNRDNPGKLKAVATRFVGELKTALARAPDHPRLLWVWGAQQWYQKDHAAAYSTYERALRLIREQRRASADRLEPAWGEPELLMTLAWANLNRTPPDPVAAEALATQALALVPHWRYVRDILLPQIRKARTGF